MTVSQDNRASVSHRALACSAGWVSGIPGHHNTHPLARAGRGGGLGDSQGGGLRVVAFGAGEGLP